MIQRVLSSKNFVACLLAAATGMALFFKLPFPAENVFLQLMALRAPLVHEGLFYSYNLFLFTTPYIVYSILLSGLYVFGLTVHKKIRAGKLPVPGELIRWQVLDLCNIVTFSSPDRLDFSFLFLNVTDLKGIRAGRHFRSR